MPLFMPFRPYSIAVQKSACSTPCAAIRTNRLVPIRTRAAKNGISIFIGFIPSFYPQSRQGLCHTDGRLESADKYRESEKLTV
jgi:hypothetical protein